MNQDTNFLSLVGWGLVTYLFLIPFVMVGWNLGLQPSGVVQNDIDWITALGLSVCLMLVRLVVSAARSVNVQVPHE